ncbi:MAG: exo-alpha-sialidase, partial [Acidobacteriales bacterium]|nr:exo-alpha-sialidase [Terriglobales bacterium]
MAIFFAITPFLTAQSNHPLEHLPYSGGVLAARAYRAGRLVPQNGGFGLLGPTDLVCSPAPCVFTPVRASPGGQPANESPLATNPRNPMQFLSGANDYNCGNIQGFYSTNDGGTTWTHTCSKGSGGEGDPVVAYDLQNTAISGGIQNGNFVVFTSTDNGTTWSNPITVTSPLLGSLADKPWLEADNNPGSPFAGSLYISGTQFASNSDSEISLSRSRDSGKTWSTVVVDTKQIFPAFVDQFSDVAVGRDGTVYVSWLRCPANGPSGDCGGTTANFLLAKSTDGGATFGAPITIATTTLAPDPDFCCFYGELPNTFERVSDIPSITVVGSGATARVFVTYYKYTGGFLQVLLATSNDGGNTFNGGVPVSPASTDQFFP